MRRCVECEGGQDVFGGVILSLSSICDSHRSSSLRDRQIGDALMRCFWVYWCDWSWQFFAPKQLRCFRVYHLVSLVPTRTDWWSPFNVLVRLKLVSPFSETDGLVRCFCVYWCDWNKSSHRNHCGGSLCTLTWLTWTSSSSQAFSWSDSQRSKSHKIKAHAHRNNV